ncbi:MAG: tripartite tricarboxylate transporter substrate binding protein [Pseudomonadota bacterium]
MNQKLSTRTFDTSFRCGRRQTLALLGAMAGMAGVAGLPRTARAAVDYPTKPVRMMVPYPAGGPTDIVGRVLAMRLSELWQQPVTVDNRGGASGMIGADIVAKAPADGYTLMVNVSGQLVNPALYSKMPHDPLKDFTPITNVASTPIQLVIAASSPVRSVRELVEMVRAQPGRHTFASSSSGTPGHLAGEVFKNMAKLDVTHVPYKGSAPALTDIIGGQVTYMFDSMPSSIQLVKGGKLRSLAVTSARRAAALPDTPTFTEAGYPDMNLSTWYGMWAPAGMAPDLVTRINADVVSSLAQPDIRARLADVMAEGVGDSPAHFAAFCQSEAARYAGIVKAAGIKLEG